MRSTWRWLLTVGVVMAASGCKPASYGVVRVLSADGVDGLLDFGIVTMGTSTTREVVISNDGDGALTLTGFTKVNASDAATKAGAGVDDLNPIFTLSFDEALTVPSHETARVSVAYAPPFRTDVTSELHRVVLKLNATNTAEGSAVTQLTLQGTALAGDCDLPTSIDFGAVATGDSFTRTLEFHNARAVASTGFVEPLDGGSGFTLTPESPRGEFSIAAQDSQNVTFVFSPTEARVYASAVRIARDDGCPESSVQLLGAGVSSVIEFAPAPVDFGFVPRGLTKNANVNVQNRSFSTVTLTSLSINDQGASTPSTVFTRLDSGSSIDVPPGVRAPDGGIEPGTATMQLSFAPTTLGVQRAAFNATAGGHLITLPLIGVGGGPDIEVTPSDTLDLDAGTPFSGVIAVRNVGDHPSPPDAKGDLHLGQRTESGGYGAPYWEVIPHGAATLEEICVGEFDLSTNTCTNTLPFAVIAAGAAPLEIPVRVVPASAGVREWEVRIFSDDLDEPVTTVIIRVDAT